MINKDSVATEVITIDAPAEFVWEILVDFPNYHRWNRFCPQAEGKLEVGSPLAMQVDLGNGLQEQVETITVIEPPHRIVWSMENKPGDPIHADRAQVITPLSDTSCTYQSIDQFAGEAVPQMMEAMAEAVERGFTLCAECLKEYAEAEYRSRGSRAEPDA